MKIGCVNPIIIDLGAGRNSQVYWPNSPEPYSIKTIIFLRFSRGRTHIILTTVHPVACRFYSSLDHSQLHRVQLSHTESEIDSLENHPQGEETVNDQ